jgi:hypothetical protein
LSEDSGQMDNGYKSTITTRLKLPQVSDERRYGWKVKSVAVAFPAVTEERRPITQLRPRSTTPFDSASWMRRWTYHQSIFEQELTSAWGLRTQIRSTGRASGGRSPGALNRENVKSLKNKTQLLPKASLRGKLIATKISN